MSKPNYSIIYNGVDLSLIDGVRITNWTVNNLPSRDLQQFKLARKSRSILTSAEFVDKEILVEGFISKNTVAESEVSFAALKAAIQQANGVLTVNQFGATILYTCTLYTIDHHYLGNYMYFSILFNCADPIGRENQPTSLFSTTVTVQSIDTVATFGGSAPAEPYFTLTVNSVTGGTGQSITVKNSDTGEGITVTRNWAGSDILNIDSRNRTISVNGTEVDYSGIFPTFTPGTHSVGYIDSLTTRNVTFVASYYKRYV